MRINRDSPLVVADRLEAVHRNAIVRSTLAFECADVRSRSGCAWKSGSALICLQLVRVVSRVDGRAVAEQGVRLHGADAIGGQRAQFRARGDRSRGKTDGR